MTTRRSRRVLRSLFLENVFQLIMKRSETELTQNPLQTDPAYFYLIPVMNCKVFYPIIGGASEKYPIFFTPFSSRENARVFFVLSATECLHACSQQLKKGYD